MYDQRRIAVIAVILKSAKSSYGFVCSDRANDYIPHFKSGGLLAGKDQNYLLYLKNFRLDTLLLEIRRFLYVYVLPPLFHL